MHASVWRSLVMHTQDCGVASLRVRLSVGLRDAVATYLTLNVQIFPSSVTRLCIREKKKVCDS